MGRSLDPQLLQSNAQACRQCFRARPLREQLGHDWNEVRAVSAASIGDNAGKVSDFTSAVGMRATSVPFNARQTEAEIDRVIQHAEPAAMLFTSAVSAEAQAHSERMGAKPMQGCQGLDGVTLRSSPVPELEDVATLLYTTGTTGTPKGVMLTHANLIFGGSVACETRKVTPDDKIYGVLPFSHVFGLTSIVMATVLSGATLRIARRFVPANLYEALNSGVTLLSAVPQMHALLMQYTKEQGFDHLQSKSLRYVSSGAAPLDLDWKRRAEAFYGLPLQNGYGMTETTAGASLTRHTESNDDISVGQPFPGVRIKLDRNAPNSQGEVGEVLVGGGGVMKGYFRNPEETAKVLTSDGWLRTGDLGRMDSDGNLHIVGRSKELIIHGGFNVYPPEVEAALNDHPQVIQCAVAGHVLDGDELVYAYVEASPDDWPNEAELSAFTATKLAGYKRPTRIIVVEKLPTAPTGKVLKSKLAELLL
jgi:acyl-CoA synthetase (AMP-forming)/AMP-acid ligase II